MRIGHSIDPIAVVVIERVNVRHRALWISSTLVSHVFAVSTLELVAHNNYCKERPVALVTVSVTVRHGRSAKE